MDKPKQTEQQALLQQLAQSPMIAAEKWNQQMILWVDQLSALMLNEASRRGQTRCWIRLRTRDGGVLTVASFMPTHPMGFLAIAPVPENDQQSALRGPDDKLYTPTVRLLPFDSISGVEFGFDAPKTDRPLGFAATHNYQPDHAELATLHLGPALERLAQVQAEVAKEYENHAALQKAETALKAANPVDASVSDSNPNP